MLTSRRAPDARPERVLLHFPILHTQADLGGLGEDVQRAAIRKVGRRARQRSTSRVDDLWERVEQALVSLQLDHRMVRVYQDGLPVCGREDEIVAQLAESGSRNHQILARLREAGATLMGTEDPQLLVEEYQLARQTTAGGEATGARIAPRQRASGQSLLERRDRFIADRINGTLLPGETGILFLGMLHSLGEMLDRDIRVVHPVHHPLAGGHQHGRNQRADPGRG